MAKIFMQGDAEPNAMLEGWVGSCLVGATLVPMCGDVIGGGH